MIFRLIIQLHDDVKDGKSFTGFCAAGPAAEWSFYEQNVFRGTEKQKSRSEEEDCRQACR